MKDLKDMVAKERARGRPGILRRRARLLPDLRHHVQRVARGHVVRTGAQPGRPAVRGTPVQLPQPAGRRLAPSTASVPAPAGHLRGACVMRQPALHRTDGGEVPVATRLPPVAMRARNTEQRRIGDSRIVSGLIGLATPRLAREAEAGIQKHKPFDTQRLVVSGSQLPLAPAAGAAGRRWPAPA
jgi:hypothetical protein